MEQITKAHKENWKPSSLMPVNFSFEFKYEIKIRNKFLRKTHFNVFVKLSAHEVSGMMVNISRHCDFLASTIKFIYSEANQENSNTMKVSVISLKLRHQTKLRNNSRNI